MGFDIKKYETTKFRERTFDVPVLELKKFFEEDKKCLWTVRGLEGEELAIVNEAVSSNKNTVDMVAAITSAVSKEKVDVIKQLMGLKSSSVPDDLVKRIEMLTMGSINPVCSQTLAVKIAKNNPTTFFKLTNKIIQLTGQGNVGE